MGGADVESWPELKKGVANATVYFSYVKWEICVFECLYIYVCLERCSPLSAVSGENWQERC